MSSSHQPDHYAALGVQPDATDEQITHAYRALLRRHHPDTRASDAHDHARAADARLQQVIRAYAVLHDPARRAGYDRSHRPRAAQRDTRPHLGPPPATVVLGTPAQPKPAWIESVDTSAANPTWSARGDLLAALLHDLLDRPG
jgi:curved DNA-binding protein CbpA